MLYTNTINEGLELSFKSAMAKSDIIRQSLHQDMAAFYFNDYEEICEVLKKDTLNNPYSTETLKTLQFRHVDQIEKILKRRAAGIYSQAPIRKLMTGEETEDKNLIPLLDEINYSRKVKECFLAALFFNVAFIQPVYDTETGAMRLDVITPNDVAVKSKDSDYLQIEAIKIRKCYGKEIRYSVWTDSEHYYIEGENEYSYENNPDGVNPFGVIPVSTLRIREGGDFYGEPNWNLYLFQKDFDVNLTEMKLAEQRTLHQVWLAVNCGLKTGDILTPGHLITVNDLQEGQPIPSLESVTSNYDFAGVRENTDWLNKIVALSQGLSSSSVSTKVDDLSGIAKSIDNQELHEGREEMKQILYDFEVDLLEKIRMVYNTYSGQKLNENGEFYVEFIKDPASETIQEKIQRREMERGYGYKNEIDFAIEDLELSSREEAAELLKRNAEEIKQLNPEAE